jgi:hypothetical protein
VITSMASGHQLALSLLAMILVAVGVTYGLVSGIAAMFVAVVFVAALWVLKPLLLPAGYGTNKVRLLSLTLSAALVATHTWWAGLVESGVRLIAQSPDVQRMFPGIESAHIGQTPSQSSWRPSGQSQQGVP